MDCIDSIPLSEVKTHDTLPLWRAAMKDVGPAAQTLAAIDRMTRQDNKTFASYRVIGQLACLPVRTVRRHVKVLLDDHWLWKIGRKGRRTNTLSIPDLIRNDKHREKWAVLPRWAAMILPSWAERAVFALVISRDLLCSKIGDENRRQYPVVMLAKECGLASRSIDLAKRKLFARGLLTIDRSSRLRDEHGRIQSGADVLLLNADFSVPKSILDRCAELAANRGAKVAAVAALNGSDTRKSGHCPPANLAAVGRKNGHRSYRELVKEPLHERAEPEDLRAIDQEERRQKVTDELHRIRAAEPA